MMVSVGASRMFLLIIVPAEDWEDDEEELGSLLLVAGEGRITAETSSMANDRVIGQRPRQLGGLLWLLRL